MMMTSNWVATDVLWWMVARGGWLPDQRQRILQHRLERLQELRARRAVDHPVIARNREPEPSPGRELPLVHDRFLNDPPDRQDPGLGRIDHRRELLDVEHAQVGDREGAAGVFLRGEPALAR